VSQPVACKWNKVREFDLLFFDREFARYFALIFVSAPYVFEGEFSRFSLLFYLITASGVLIDRLIEIMFFLYHRV